MAKSNEEMFTELVAIMDDIESTQCLYRYFDKDFVNKFYDVKDDIKFLINDDYWNDADDPNYDDGMKEPSDEPQSQHNHDKH